MNNLLDRLTRVVDRNGYATVYEYDANGNRTAVHYANGLTVTYDYDLLNRLICEKIVDINGDIVVQYTYTLGAALRCIRIFCIGGLTNGSIQFILKKKRERLICRSQYKVIFLRLMILQRFFRRASVTFCDVDHVKQFSVIRQKKIFITDCTQTFHKQQEISAQLP